MEPAAQAYVDRVTRRSGSNFYYSFLFLPAPRRRAIHALYAFCREVDDSVDATDDAVHASAKVAFWRQELDACYAGRPTHPVTLSLAEHLPAYPIRREDLAAVIDGVAMDITPRRYETFEELRGYCLKVASAVGLACIEIFGYRDPRARDYAVTLGLAFQLTNILRDVRRDAERGRVYLPQVDLAAAGCPESDLAASTPSAPFQALMRLEAERARSLFEAARRTLPPADRGRLYAAEIMAAIYEAILDKIERRGYDVLGDRVSLSAPRKMALAAGVYLRSKTA